MQNNKVKTRVLIAEEDDDWRELLLFALADEGYSVRGAKGFSVAWRLLQHWPCQIVLCADCLGGLDGLSCLKIIKERFPKVYCVALLSCISENAVQNRLPDYLAGAVYKPFDLAALQRLLRSLLQPRWAFLQRWAFRWGHFKNWLYGHWRGWYLSRASKQRDACLRLFFEHIRSGRLLLGGALAAWDGLEELETVRNKAGSGGADCWGLAEGYRCLGEFIASSALSSRWYCSNKRSLSAVNYRVFADFFAKVRRGELSLEQFSLAPSLRQGQNLSSELKRLFQQIWGEESPDATPWSLARQTLENGTGVWQSRSLKIKKLTVSS